MPADPSKSPITLTDPEDRSKLPQITPHQPSLDYYTITLGLMALSNRNDHLFDEPEGDLYYDQLCIEHRLLDDAMRKVALATKALNHTEELNQVEAALDYLYDFQQRIDLNKIEDPEFIPQVCKQLELAKTALEQGETLIAPPEAPDYANLIQKMEEERKNNGPHHPAGNLYAHAIDYIAGFDRNDPELFDCPDVGERALDKMDDLRNALIRADENHDPDIERIYLERVLKAVEEAQQAWRIDQGKDNLVLTYMLPRLETRRDALDGHSQEPPDLPPRG